MSGRPGSNRRRSAWKADALPTELLPRCLPQSAGVTVWRVMDSNHRRHSRQIYSLLPLATRATLRKFSFFRTFLLSSLSNSLAQRIDELARGIEPLTTCLQNRCSTVELRQPSRRRPPLRGREDYFPTRPRASNNDATRTGARDAPASSRRQKCQGRERERTAEAVFFYLPGLVAAAAMVFFCSMSRAVFTSSSVKGIFSI